jgi:hypothetical protein
MTREEILAQLDEAARNFIFPMLDNGYAYPADVRLTTYRDATRWAMVIETVEHSPRGGGHEGLRNVLHVHGNCILGAPGPMNEDFITRTADPPEGPLYSDECDWALITKAGTILVRDRPVPFDLSEGVLQRKGITPAEEGQLSAIDLLRSLLPEHRDLFLASDQEKRRRIPQDLPLFMCLDEWHHPDLAGDELPSDSPCFQMIADAIVSGDPSRYQPVRPPNTHWRNWPHGGTM